MTPLARAVIFHGMLGFGVFFAAFSLGWDAIEGRVPDWPRSVLTYGSVVVVAGGLYGLIWRWLERRYDQPR